MSYAGLGQTVPLPMSREAPPTTYAPNWMGIRIFAALVLIPAGIAGAWTGSRKKAAITGVGAGALTLALIPMIPFGGGVSSFFVRRVYAPTTATLPAYVRGSGVPGVIA